MRGLSGCLSQDKISEQANGPREGGREGRGGLKSDSLKKGA